MKKELILLIISVGITLVTAIGIIRWQAPQLLGIPVDLQLVKVQEEVPPFFENIFRNEAILTNSAIINDPLINRGRQLVFDSVTYGPGDLLGFRNRSIPNVTDIITIGDSQTYGNNATLEKNWPSQMAAGLQGKQNILYNMSIGAWGATQYLDIFQKAKWFFPRLIIVAFYTGNDPLDSFIQVYGNDRWRDFRPDKSLSKSDAPAAKYPDPNKVSESEFWQINFQDGTIMTFTPKYRHAANKYDDPAVRAGYTIMARSAQMMGSLVQQSNVNLIFTIIPTKELVYAKRVLRENQSPRTDYLALVTDEQKNVNELEKTLRGIPDATYVDVITPLQSAALQDATLYPASENGHPWSAGYSVISQTILPYARKMLPDRPDGPVIIGKGRKQENELYVINNDKLWYFISVDLFKKNGWHVSQLKSIQRRDIENMPYAEVVSEIDPNRFGPDAPFFSNLK